MHHQLEGLLAGLPEYAYFGKGRKDGKTGGEFSAIYYKKDKYKLQEEGTFWLAPDNERPGIGWDAALPRVCTWGSFQDRQFGLSFYIFNIHFDHKGVQARQESTHLLLAKIRKIAGTSPVVLTGDFNFNQNHENYNMLNSSGFLRDSYTLAKVKYAANGTFNGFDVNRTSEDRIDFIFTTSAFEVKRYGILTDTCQGRFPSDHFPVLVEVEYKP